MLQIRRIYEAPQKDDGYRVLVDRLWLRGVSKERAALDDWMKDIAPSPELRIWFGHDPKKFNEFKERYKEELKHNPATATLARIVSSQENVTLLYAAKDPEVNHALVLKEFILAL